MSKGRTSGAVDGFGGSGISNNILMIGNPSLELKSKSSNKGNNNFAKKRRIYQLGLTVPCIENDEECSHDEAESK